MKQEITGSDISDLQPVTFKNPGKVSLNTLQNKNTIIRFGDDTVKVFDKNEAPKKVRNKKKRRNHNSSRKNFKDQRYYGSILKDFLKKFTLSGRIWRHVWLKCRYVRCYSQNNFAVLYGNYLSEINLLRKVHGVRSLQFDYRLGKKASEFAKKNYQVRHLLFGQNYTNGEMSTVASISELPFVVHKWYQENSRYNYKAIALLTKSVHFSTMIWRSSSKVGIGFYRQGNSFYITFLFWPEGNQKFQFRRNVPRPNYRLCNSRNFFRM
uniref:SCP domain-containing protein n=1 Tax=Strongyloides venezuelensis TaxID=75913 RepID=A0A0K0G213_STRVS